jgi:ferredoxin-NADP reductase
MALLRISRISPAADGVFVFELADPSGRPLASWTPGAHVDVTLPRGMTRQYSLCSDPQDRTAYRIAVLRVETPHGRGGSCWMHDNLSVGDLLHVGSPRNTFPLPEAGRYLLLAGGIGITPVAAMAYELHRRNRDWSLVYGARRRSAMALADELLDLDAERVRLMPQDELGLPPLEQLLEHRPGLAVLACGPEPMLQEVAKLCADWPAGSLHTERFSPAPCITGGRADHAFVVELARSGLRLRVEPTQSVLDAMRAAGLNPPSSCEHGVCGTCETGVLSGQVEHRDHLLTEAERGTNQTMMLCVSRAAGQLLVLDC